MSGLKEDSRSSGASAERSRGVLTEEEAWKLAMADATVEKAQYHLTIRAKLSNAAGVLLIAAAVGVAAYFYSVAHHELKDEYVKTLKTLSVQAAILVGLERLVLGALFIGGIAVMISLARSFFHEATLLYRKRHRLREVRLKLHLLRARVDFRELSQILALPDDLDSAFAKNESEKNMKTTIAALGDLVGKLSEGLAKISDKKLKD
ncbi:hypothetical protein [Rhodobacter viridis]|uniref:hypothetical protein n=1 Tax=Rhodobacter viridis TaxID=1054202 RepID=UPI001C64C4DD|nr:hypothetical protein [Rhodobacter viridis]